MEAAAFPLPDDNYGQTVAAAIARRPGENVDEMELRKLCTESIGEYRAPSQYFFLDELPKGPSGKSSASNSQTNSLIPSSKFNDYQLLLTLD